MYYCTRPIKKKNIDQNSKLVNMTLQKWHHRHRHGKFVLQFNTECLIDPMSI